MNKSKPFLLSLIAIICAGMVIFLTVLRANENNAPLSSEESETSTVTLPEPRRDSDISVEEALLNRRSVRKFAKEPLTRAEVSQLLWAAQGITNERGYRTAPSAGALYPLELYVAVGNVEGITTGVYKYRPDGHELIRIGNRDVREQLSDVAVGQSWVGEGAIVIVFGAVYERTTQKYDDRGIKYVHIEVGHAAQNVYLQAGALDLGTVIVGAFYDDEIKKSMNMENAEIPLCIMPVGKK